MAKALPVWRPPFDTISPSHSVPCVLFVDCARAPSLHVTVTALTWCVPVVCLVYDNMLVLVFAWHTPPTTKAATTPPPPLPIRVLPTLAILYRFPLRLSKNSLHVASTASYIRHKSIAGARNATQVAYTITRQRHLVMGGGTTVSCEYHNKDTPESTPTHAPPLHLQQLSMS